MKIIVTGSLGNIGKPLTELLVAGGHEVVVVTHTDKRKNEIEALRAKPAIGSVWDPEFLAKTFSEADAVFAMTPPTIGIPNTIQHLVQAGQAFADAFQKANVKRVVMLSSIGADLSAGNGPIAALHQIENLYRQLTNVAVTFLRAGYFYTNYYNEVPMIKGAGIIGANYPASTSLPLVHPKDIATAAAEELQKSKVNSGVRYIVSDIKVGSEIAKTIGTAIGKPELPWIEFTDEQSLTGMKQAGLPEENAMLFTEMGQGLRNGLVQRDFIDSGSPVDGKTKFVEFAKELSAKILV